MWFKSKTPTATFDPSQQLASLMANGVSITINELLQYQNKASLINLTANKNLHGQLAGNYLARTKGRGMEFDEVRHYQTGDDIRTIDWRVTARTGETHTKLFREEIERPVIVATDLSSNMLFGSKLLFKSVQAAHLAALLAWHTKQRGDRFGGIVFNESSHTELKPRSRQQGVLHYLHALTTCHQQSSLLLAQDSPDVDEKTHAFAQNCLRLRQVSRPGSLVYFITDGHHTSDEAIRHLANINRHCELVVCLISDPLEHQLPSVKTKVNVSITDGQHKQQLTLGDQNTAAEYAAHAQSLISEKEALLEKAGARLLHFCAGQSLEQQIKNGVAPWIR
ncbi:MULTISPECIES: DUF58 domain-containing protein [Thalassotalea]|uniref:DUF58 domain-containing protein n=1 Tax=Thalassotalea TaxID=1518149 RepID=UPI0009447CA4|nr:MULTISPECIES: DUF58 domain-containing protein [Thalassotalea]OKY24622.1 hypothetical protein BI291_05345 [Thalassotalea sp. PP2-459]